MNSFDPSIAEELDHELPLRVGLEPAWDEVLARAGSAPFGSERSQRVRRRRSLAAAAAAALLTATFLATPAWGLVRDVLPFSNQPSAPSSVKVEFSRMGLGAPAGISPAAVSGDTRKIAQMSLGGETKTLWVAPATGRFDFCWVWDPNFAGSCGSATQPLGVLWMASNDNPDASQLITGYAISPTVSDVVVQFSDGSSIHPQIDWVSAPINAGFFAYNVPADRQSSADHATEIDAYDQNGKLVDQQTLSGG